ncbi:putative transmembrane protein precursor [Sphingobium herbicidovorans NBRC 16415]|uniref:Transmembrane protein n=1 Tax=Sphingobium herbicidovorans (strain ATCC 700291 / DSM 11019 / CCUG 56400 / KCTC 2939 / LMG 18315 / NBRC 16415 / MH) TaxID=1219045 RepID=A0A086PBD9_SPHHM|nr:TIGR02186 family protein [Sphingobium herbicidovorans]KFG90707.1 putative transmembrane protein precursor [Sphingobium herbicidovorans NBRC 16415]
MSLRARLTLLPAILLLGAAGEPILVPDVSQREVKIQYSFTGADLLLFGAIVYPDGRLPKEPAEILVVLKGPAQSIIMREKQKVAGIWINADSARFRSAPSFYAVASSRPIAEVVDDRTAAIYELGVNKLQLSPSSLNDSAELERFQAGLIDLRERTGLFAERPGSVEITQGVLYRARLPLPARVIVGDYTAETFLVQNGRVVAAAVRDIKIRKSGFERFMAVAAEQWPFLYGLTAILLAGGMGWAAGALARRF